MPHSEPARPTTRPIRIQRHRAGGVLAIVAIAAALGCSSLVASPSKAPSPATTPPSSPATSRSSAAAPVDPPRNEQRGALGEAGGAVPDGTTIFDEEVPGVANLDPALLRTLRKAATAAAADGVELVVTSGWRSPAYEDQLRREAVAKYGSEAAAARWVATGTTSPHVSGDAVDLGPAHATPWLSGHGAAYGLCQIYRNEPWHYELRPDAVARGCPRMYADPTRDPRMQQ